MRKRSLSGYRYVSLLVCGSQKTNVRESVNRNVHSVTSTNYLWMT